MKHLPCSTDVCGFGPSSDYFGLFNLFLLDEAGLREKTLNHLDTKPRLKQERIVVIIQKCSAPLLNTKEITKRHCLSYSFFEEITKKIKSEHKHYYKF